MSDCTNLYDILKLFCQVAISKFPLQVPKSYDVEVLLQYLLLKLDRISFTIFIIAFMRVFIRPISIHIVRHFKF